MTRSEMVNQMASYWLGILPYEVFADAELFADIQEQMSKLLGIIEYRGMLPPPLSKGAHETTGDHTSNWESE